MKSDYTPGPSACGSCTGFLVSHHAIVCISIGWSFGESKNSLLLASFNLLMMQRQTETDEIRLRVLDRQRYTFNGFFCGLSIGTHSLWWQPSANDMFWLLSILHTFESPFLFRHLAPHILNIIERNTSSLRNINGKVREALPPLYRPCPICMTSQLPLSPAPDFLNEFRFRKGNHIRRHSFTKYGSGTSYGTIFAPTICSWAGKSNWLASTLNSHTERRWVYCFLTWQPICFWE